METSRITKIKFLSTLREKNISLFTVNEIQNIFGITKTDTLKHLLKRLEDEKIIKRLSRGKYLFLHAQNKPSDFQLANFLVNPSYVSLESALSFYSLIEQFPYRITSLTIAKTKEFNVEGKIFTYSRIKKEFFKDYVKIDGYLIATKEKTLFDYLYFIFKGLRSTKIIDDLIVFLNQKSVKNYLLSNSDKKFKKFIEKYVKL